MFYLVVFFGVHLLHHLKEFLQVLVLLPGSCHVVLPGHRDHWFDCCLEFWSFAFFSPIESVLSQGKPPNIMATWMSQEASKWLVSGL